MNRKYESITIEPGTGEGRPGDSGSLPFEAEFDGARRPQAGGGAAPCDPGRYWDYFSGTD
jgi:hypothetical protein